MPHPAVLKCEYLELGIEFLYSVKSAEKLLNSSFIQTQNVFLTLAPYRLKEVSSARFSSSFLYQTLMKTLLTPLLSHLRTTLEPSAIF